MKAAKDMIKIIIAEDEPSARASMEILLGQVRDVEIVASCRDGKEALAAIYEHRPELVLLDIQMPEMDGFEVIKALQGQEEPLPVFIFVTAYDQYAIKAFEQSACDYLLKPYDDERFFLSLEKARKMLQAQQIQQQWQQFEKLFQVLPSGPLPSAQEKRPSRLTLKSQKRISFVEVAEITYIESEGNFVKIHTREGMKVGNYTFKQLQELLDPQKFVRIHKSFMVNTDHIQYLEPHFHGDYFVFLKGGHKLKLSRSYKESLARLFQ